MATIKFVVDVINNASAGFRDVARAADDLSRKLDELGRRSDRLNQAFRQTGASMRVLQNATERLDTKFRQLNEKAALLGNQFTQTRRAAASLETRFLRLAVRVNETAREIFLLGREMKDLSDSTSRLAAAMDGLRATTEDADAALAKLTAAASLAAAAMTRLAAKTVLAGAATRIAFRGWWGLLGLLRGSVPLFLGVGTGLAALLHIPAWHLAIDVLAEFLTVVLAATIALIAFGVAGSDAFREIFHHVQNAHIVMDAFGKSIPPATGALERLHVAVRPAVLQLFGDALLIIKSRAGEFATVAKGAAHVVDLLAARFTAALLHGRTFGELIRTAVPDLAALGATIGNVGGIFGAFFRALPGYAAILAQFFAGLTHVAEIIANMAVPVLRVGLALHGALIWFGLATTAAFLLGKAVVFLAVQAIPQLIVRMQEFIILAADNPLAWIAVAVGLIVGLIYWLGSAKTHAQEFGDAMQSALLKTDVFHTATTLARDHAVVTARLAKAQEQLANTTKFVDGTILRSAGATKVISRAYAEAAQKVADYRAQQAKLSGETRLYNSRVAGLTRTYGSAATVQRLLNDVGAVTGDLLDKDKVKWALLQQQVAAYEQALRAVEVRTGAMGAANEIMDNQISDTYKAIQQVNQAFDTFIGNMTASQQSFDTVAQGAQSLSDAFKNTGKNAETIRISLGKLHSNFAFAKSGIDDLTKSGIALNQAFTTQVTNLNALFDTFRQAGISQNLYTEGVKLGIAPLVKYAAGSKEAMAQLVGLAQEAGFHLAPTLKNLVGWLGNTHNATKRLKEIANQATIQMALLSSSMGGLGKMIANQLLGQLTQEALKISGVTADVKAWGDAIARHGRQSDEAHAARQRLIDDAIKIGDKFNEAAGKTAAFITKLTGIPPKVALRLVLIGEGKITLTHIPPGVAGKILAGKGAGNQAAGGYISGSGGPTDDLIPAMLSNGEYVVRASSVDKYGPGMLDAINSGAFALGGLIKRFASGGVVEQGNRAVIDGSMGTAFVSQITALMVREMSAALRAAVKAATAAMAKASFGAAGPGGGAPGANAALARRMFPGENFAAWNYVAMRESFAGIQAALCRSVARRL